MRIPRNSPPGTASDRTSAAMATRDRSTNVTHTPHMRPDTGPDMGPAATDEDIP